MKGFHVSASGAIQGHHDPLVVLHRLRKYKPVTLLVYLTLYHNPKFNELEIKTFENMLGTGEKAAFK